MTNRDTILNELIELGSPLASHNPQNPYSVPAGYFETLAAVVINRIKALEASDAKEELEFLSPFLAGISRKNPFTVPSGYFESMQSFSVPEPGKDLSASQELDLISPLLGRADKKTPYTVPEGYFDNLPPQVMQKTMDGGGKLVSITARKWFRYAAAAVITGVITTLALILLVNSQVDPNKNPHRWVQKNVEKKVSEEQLDAFVAMVGDEPKSANGNRGVSAKEVEELVKDIPKAEIEQFLMETSAPEIVDSEILMD